MPLQHCAQASALRCARIHQCTPSRRVTLTRLPHTAAFNCDDWFDGSANQQFLDALASFGLPGNLVPAVSCRVSEEVVHNLEMVGAAPGTTLADDPRKVRGWGVRVGLVVSWAGRGVGSVTAPSTRAATGTVPQP